MQALLGVADLFDRISRGAGRTISWIILFLVALIMFDVVTRKIEFIKRWSADLTIEYGYSVSFILQDLQWHVHGILLMMTFGFGYLMNAHVRVDIFREQASRRGQVWVEFWGLLICAIPFLLVMIYYSWIMTSSSYTQGEGSESQVGIGMRFIIKSFLVWGFLIVFLAVIATFIRCIAYLWGNEENKAWAESKLQFFTDEDLLSKMIREQNEQSKSGSGGASNG